MHIFDYNNTNYKKSKMESNIISGNSAALTNLYKDSPVIQLLKIGGNEPESEEYKAAITAIENRIKTEINRTVHLVMNTVL